MANSHQIDIDRDVFKELQRLATPLVDDANSVLRRILGLPTPAAEVDVNDDTGAVEHANRSAPRDTEMGLHTKPGSQDSKATERIVPESIIAAIPRGSRLPQANYELPILEALIELGGSAPSSRVVERVGQKLRDRLAPVDFTRVKSGETRWENRVRFARLMLKNRGEVAKDSPHGTWEITGAGRSRVGKSKRSG